MTKIAGVQQALDDILQASSIFRHVKAEDRAQLALLAHVRRYVRGDLVFSEGEPSSELFTITAGRVKVFRVLPNGKEVILQVFGVGDPLGAVATYEGHPFPASAMALEEASCLALPRDAFFALLEHRPSLVRGLLHGMTLRLMEMNGRLTDLASARIEARLARLFLKLAESDGRSERGGTFVPAAFSRQELADMTGTTIETCIRIMSRWGKQGIVVTEKGGFLIADRPALDGAANG